MYNSKWRELQCTLLICTYWFTLVWDNSNVNLLRCLLHNILLLIQFNGLKNLCQILANIILNYLGSMFRVRSTSQGRSCMFAGLGTWPSQSQHHYIKKRGNMSLTIFSTLIDWTVLRLRRSSEPLPGTTNAALLLRCLLLRRRRLPFQALKKVVTNALIAETLISIC